jgi:hypothetical protein
MRWGLASAAAVFGGTAAWTMWFAVQAVETDLEGALGNGAMALFTAGLAVAFARRARSARS